MVDIGVGLSDEERAIRDSARKFADEVMRPAGTALDRLDHPAQVVANFHQLFAQMSGRPALIDRFGREDSKDIGCWAVTEPDHGSDTLTVSPARARRGRGRSDVCPPRPVLAILPSDWT